MRIISQEQQSSLPIIPFPKECKQLPGNFVLSSSIKIVATSPKVQNEIDWLNDYLKTYYGFTLQIVHKQPKNGNYIQFIIPDWEADNKENYHLTISENAITILAEGNSAGNFYALQTLIQLLPIEKGNALLIPCVQIKDSPRFEWRGMHLDVSRHFFPISFIKKYIDILALYKMNTFIGI